MADQITDDPSLAGPRPMLKNLHMQARQMVNRLVISNIYMYILDQQRETLVYINLLDGMVSKHVDGKRAHAGHDLLVNHGDLLRRCRLKRLLHEAAPVAIGTALHACTRFQSYSN